MDRRLFSHCRNCGSGCHGHGSGGDNYAGSSNIEASSAGNSGNRLYRCGGVTRCRLDQMSLPGSRPLRTDLTEALRTIEAGSQVWAVGDFSIPDLPDLRGPAPALELLKSLRSGTYQMRVDQDLHARATGNFADAEAAKNLGDMGRGLIAVAKLQVASQPDMLHLLDGIQVRDSGASVVVNIDE